MSAAARLEEGIDLRARVAIVHDYLTQRGGAERVLLSMMRAFPNAPLHTSFYERSTTFAEFASADVRPMTVNRIGILRRHHRLALPLLAKCFDRLRPDADVVVCSSSGWAHGVGGGIPKVVYCYAPARWLYQSRRYLRDRPGAAGVALAALRPYLLGWDAAAAGGATAYLTSSSAMRSAIRAAYGFDAELLPPPQTLDPSGAQRAPAGATEGYLLCVSRLLPYKNVDAVVEAFTDLPGERLVVVGQGPELERLRLRAGANVQLVGAVDDDELRWLYANCVGLVAASYEDFGLTPLEAAAFGKPSAVLRYGGFVDTVRDGETGVFFDAPSSNAVRAAVARLRDGDWDEGILRTHAAGYSEAVFAERLRAVVAEAARGAS